MSLAPNLTEIILALAKGSKQVLLRSPETEETFVLELVKEGTKCWIKAHPIKTTLLAARAVTYLVPGVGGDSLLATLVKFGIGVNNPFAGASIFQSLVSDVLARSLFDGVQESGVREIGVGALATAAKAMAAGSQFVTGLWGRQKTVKKVRKPRTESSVLKKAAGKLKVTGAGVSRKATAKDTKKKEPAANVLSRTTAKDKKQKKTMKGVSKKVVVKKTKAEAKSAKPRKKAGNN